MCWSLAEEKGVEAMSATSKPGPENLPQNPPSPPSVSQGPVEDLGLFQSASGLENHQANTFAFITALLPLLQQGHQA